MKNLVRPMMLIALPVLVGCGQELTAGGQTGEARTVVVDDPEPTASPRETSGASLSRGAENSALAQGTVLVEASAALVRSDGRLFPIVFSPVSASVRIASSDTAEVASPSIDAGLYRAVRLTFRRVEASVTGGLVVGGVSVTGTVQVPLPTPLTFELAIPLRIERGGDHLVVIDLNASDWLAAVDPLTRIVPAASFQSQIRVRAQ